MKEERYYKNLELWSIDATFEYDYKREKGKTCFCLGFPDYCSKGNGSEFEVNIKSLTPNNNMSTKEKRDLKAKLLIAMDHQKSIVYSDFLEDLKNKGAL